jgi:hypothetical protein
MIDIDEITLDKLKEKPETDIVRCLAIIHQNKLVEIRLPKNKQLRTLAGYYTDYNAVAKDVKMWNGRRNIYMVMNELNPALIARCPNKIDQLDTTTQDDDIIHRTILYIDIDAHRADGISSTDIQHDLALQTAIELVQKMKQEGWPVPIIADSGNGAHILYDCDISNNKENTELIKAFLQNLSKKYDTTEVHIDQKVFNASRITKLYGTIAVKGVNLPEYPHRMSAILFVPPERTKVTTGLITAFNQKYQQPQQQPINKYPKNETKLNWDKFKTDYNITTYNNKTGSDSSGNYVLYTVDCINNHDHKDAHVKQYDSGMMAFTCFHESCKDIHWKEYRAHYDEDYKNKIHQTATTTTTVMTQNQKPLLELPKPGKLISTFAEELVDILKDKNKLFFRTDSRDIIEIGRIKTDDGKDEFTGFMVTKPNRFITLIEQFLTPYTYIYDKELEDTVMKEKSIGSQLALTILSSEIMQSKLPKIERLFTFPLPIMHNETITFPKRGYDERFKSWLPYDAPKISNPDLTIEEAKQIIDNIFAEFCFEDEQSRSNAIAALLTPFLRGLLPAFSTRTPIVLYEANRERAGKDYLAGITGIIYEGHALEESPISNGDKNSNNNEELRKKIMAAMIASRKRLHFANNKGYINNAVFEGVVTAEKYSDRILGRSEIVTFDNEIDFSLSGNTGISYTPDFANRCIIIKLFLMDEDANSRKFENPYLHELLLHQRDILLSAMYAFVTNWITKGKKDGTLLFASFPHWARLCGGIMESAGYLNPCKSDKSKQNIGGDSETLDMKALFELCYHKNPDEPLSKHDIISLIEDARHADEFEAMNYLDFSNNGDKVKFGLKMMKFIGRVLSDIQMNVHDPKQRAPRQKYIFTKSIQKQYCLVTTPNITKQHGNQQQDTNIVDIGRVGIVGRDKPLENTGEKIYKNIYNRGIHTNPTNPTIQPTDNDNNIEKKNSVKNKDAETLDKNTIFRRFGANSQVTTILLRESTCNADLVLQKIYKLTRGENIELRISDIVLNGINEDQINCIITRFKNESILYEPISGRILML